MAGMVTSPAVDTTKGAHVFSPDPFAGGSCDCGWSISYCTRQEAERRWYEDHEKMAKRLSPARREELVMQPAEPNPWSLHKLVAMDPSRKRSSWFCSACDWMAQSGFAESEAAERFREYHQKKAREETLLAGGSVELQFPEDEQPPKIGDGRPLDVQLRGVWDVLKEHTNGEHSNVCKAPAHECVDDVLNDRETTIRQLTKQRDIEGAANLRLIEENRQMRALIHTLTGDSNL